MHVDLHCHTMHSDGVLTPSELIERACKNGVELLSITDHDTLAAYLEPLDTGGLTLIPGIELSTTWKNINVHILGLNVDPGSKAMREATSLQSDARDQRAELISKALAKKGLTDTLQGARQIAGTSQIGRPHFARHLVDTGKCASLKAAYKKYLGAGKAGDIKSLWAEMDTVIKWITKSGGLPVLAHPAKYKLTRTRLRSLVKDFTAQGGTGLEVVSGSQQQDITTTLGSLADDFDLLASCGSDFHTPENSWTELGKISPLPSNSRPVWNGW